MIDKRRSGQALALAVALAGFAALAQQRQGNVIKSIKTAGNQVEIELQSDSPFIQSELPVLRIGDQEFTISRAPDDGDLNIRIFRLEREDFAQANTGDPVVYQYGRGEGRGEGRGARDFGRLDKSKLDK